MNGAPLAPIVLVGLNGTLISGRRALPGAVRFVEFAKDRLALVSNDAEHTPQELARALKRLGINIAPDRLILAGATAIDLIVREKSRVRLMTDKTSTTPRSMSFNCGRVSARHLHRRAHRRRACRALAQGLESRPQSGSDPDGARVWLFVRRALSQRRRAGDKSGLRVADARRPQGQWQVASVNCRIEQRCADQDDVVEELGLGFGTGRNC
jgi:hypothetical protein